MPTAAPTLSTYSTLNDAQLLACVTSEDTSVVRGAQAEFYERHVRYLYGALRKQRPCLYALSGMSVEDLVQETFRRTFEKAATFVAEPLLEPERASRRTRAWMGRIAHRLLVDAIEGRREVAASPYVEQVVSQEPDEVPASTPLLRAVREGLASLTEREQDVLTVTALYQRVGEAHQRLPNNVADDLAKRWTISSENVRAIRSRAMKKIRDFVAARGNSPVESI
jgi:RNA polymerase sigma factor (sigma-70 family)